MPQLLGDKMRSYLGYTVPNFCPQIERHISRDRPSRSRSRSRSRSKSPKRHRLLQICQQMRLGIFMATDVQFSMVAIHV